MHISEFLFGIALIVVGTVSFVILFSDDKNGVQDFLITRGLGSLAYIGILATLFGILLVVAAFR